MTRQRYAMRVRLKPEMRDAYITYHRQVWPEVEARFALVGIDRMTLFLDGDVVFMYVEYVGQLPFDKALDAYADDPKIQEWEAMNQSCKLAEDDAAPTGFVSLDEIYHYESGPSRLG